MACEIRWYGGVDHRSSEAMEEKLTDLRSLVEPLKGNESAVVFITWRNVYNDHTFEVAGFVNNYVREEHFDVVVVVPPHHRNSSNFTQGFIGAYDIRSVDVMHFSVAYLAPPLPINVTWRLATLERELEALKK